MAEQRASILFGEARPEDKGLAIIDQLPSNLRTTVEVLHFAPRFKGTEKFGKVPGTIVNGYSPDRLGTILGELLTEIQKHPDFSTNAIAKEQFLDTHAVPDFDHLSLAVLDATKYLAGDSARTTGTYYWNKAEELRTTLADRYQDIPKPAESKRVIKVPRLNIPAKASVALASFALALEGCAGIAPKPVVTEIPGSIVTETLPSFDVEAQKAAVLSVMKPWEGKTLKDGFTLSSPIENGSLEYVSRPDMMLHQISESGDVMPGMVTIAWTSAENKSTNQNGNESFLFFTDGNGIPKQALLMEFQPSALENVLSANLVDANGNIVGHININHDLTNKDNPFASIQYTQPTAVPGNPEAKLLNVVDLKFASVTPIDSKEKFWSSLVAFATGAEPALAASGDSTIVTPTAEVATPTPTLPEVVPIADTELSAIVTKVSGELTAGCTLSASPDGRYQIMKKDGTPIDHIYLAKDGKFYITHEDQSVTILPPDVVFMPNSTYVYAGFDRIATADSSVSMIPLQGMPSSASEVRQLPRMTESMTQLYKEWEYAQEVTPGIVETKFAGADTSIGWDIIHDSAANGSYSVEALLPKGTNTTKPLNYNQLPTIDEVPVRTFLNFVTLVDHPGTSVLPVFIKNPPGASEPYSFFPGVIDTNVLISKDPKKSFASRIRQFVDAGTRKMIFTYITVAYVIDAQSPNDGIRGTTTFPMFMDGKDPAAQQARLGVLKHGIETGSFDGSDTMLWPLTGFWAFAEK